MLFVPIEGAFSVALQADGDIFLRAWDKKIVLVSPTTLLASLRTVASLWNQERQNKNALEIARQSGQLYDKFVGFIDELKELGKKLGDSQRTFSGSFGEAFGC
jgi:DNA recombination protein RmuC